ncbi:2Fe-2S iron-sulfur cluster-binding protein [Caldimonas caldifontis]|uniref:CDP-6-deoxy-delta-3,4-glucoseen reductase n=1 Tax=Caldimonas caldifontis TaxID=1452508 RepID=A0A2S5SXC4_9BURK|nr:2Fe-2S iron-sulfur cluster-binding protein [Caldimonas caldifontis]PPE67372.1 CDP-6-deoxy-delta-3,4-glucoseen reductase [Caldimonas caldifontis]
MSHRVLWLETGQTFEVEPGEAVLTAALRCDVGLPHECQFGGCGSCRVRLVDGRVDYDEPPLGLSEEEAAEGYALMCRARPQGDLVISVPRPDACSQPTRMRATVAGLRPLAREVLHLELRLPEEAGLVYRPGQYMNVLLDDGRHRSFSMASRPNGARVDFHVRRIPGGRFTDRRLAALREGESLEVEIPLGSFRYHAEDDRPLVMVATGTGLAPIKSMLESLMDSDDCPPVSLYWGMRTEDELYLHDEIQTWAERLYDFHYVPVLSRAGDGWKGRRGHVQQAVLADLGDLSEHAVYLCGSPAMIADAKTAFVARGASLDHLYTDSFVFQSA